MYICVWDGEGDDVKGERSAVMPGIPGGQKREKYRGTYLQHFTRDTGTEARCRGDNKHMNEM